MVSSRWKGIPSKESLWFPEKGGRKFGDKIWDSRFRWKIEDLMEFLFPHDKMPVFHEVAGEYLKFLLEEGKNTETGKKEFCREKGYSMNTLRKNIIPKLYRFGLIQRSRIIPGPRRNPKAKRQSIEQESLQFSTMMRKMAGEWEAIVTTARKRRKIQDQKEKDQLKQIQKLEKLEWERYLREKGEY